MQNVVYAEEMAEARAPGLYNANGVWQIGPMIMRWAPEEQQERWLPGIVGATEHWCQGFSEPEAGSDLANLRTLAVADGDEYVVNGTKVWTSTAHLARWGLFLVRTDPGAIARGAKHEGITALIVDMDVPGITCTPIREITGEAMFCEVVFTDARVPAAYRLGAEGDGWNVAMGTLAHERAGTGGIAIGLRAELAQMVRRRPGAQPRRPGRPRHPRADRPALRPDRADPAAQRPGAVQGAQGRAVLARGPAGQAPVEPPVPGPGRARRRHAGPARACWPRAAPTPWTAATPPTTTRGSATRRSAPAPPRCRRTSSPTGRWAPSAVAAAAPEELAVGVAHQDGLAAHVGVGQHLAAEVHDPGAGGGHVGHGEGQVGQTRLGERPVARRGVALRAKCSSSSTKSPSVR